MAEYIDRDLTEKALMERCNETGYGGLNRTDVKIVMRTPWRIPNADIVERKHGKWKYQTMVHESGIKANGVECSICGATYNLSITLPDMMVKALNFCPNCGADNREEEGE